MLTSFVKWFFLQAPGDIFRIGRNYLLWAWHFFSIGFFIPRILAPWHRDISSYGRGFDLKKFLHTLGWNLISRVIGAVLRLCTMAIGLVVQIFLAFAVVLILFVWLLLPIFIPAMLFISFLTLKM